MKKIFISNILAFVLLFNVCTYANIDDLPIWSEDIQTCTIPTASNSIELNSKAGILMEATNRQSAI